MPRRRKLKPGKREPNGRLSRRKADVEAVAFEHGPMQTVLQARRRRMGKDRPGPVTKEEAERLSLRHRGTPLADWRADGKISPEQYDAAEAFARARFRYRVLSGLPSDTATGAAYGVVKGITTIEDVEAAIRAKAAYTAMTRALDKKGIPVRLAVERVAIREVDAPLHLVLIGLDALRDLTK